MSCSREVLMSWSMLAGALGAVVVLAAYLCLLAWSIVAFPPDDDDGGW